MLKIYGADISKKDYKIGAEEIMSLGRLEKYKNITNPVHKNQCAAVAHLLNKALNGKAEYYDEAGKPCVDGGFISIAHSGNWALVAVSDKAVGIDIEKRRDIDAEAISSRMFTERERQSGLEFFDLWVRKESMLKKTGVGIKGCTNETADHNFLKLPEFEGYAAAVCTEEKEYELEII